MRRKPGTIDELASAIGRSRNAVRGQLAALERDGFVEHSRSRRVARGQPALVYRITPSTELALSAAYPRAATGLLALLERELPGDRVAAILRTVGGELAASAPVSSLPLRARAAAAARALDEIGGVSRLTDRNDAIEIRSHCCPLAEMTRRHPAACLALSAFVARFVGTSVAHQCERDVHDGTPHCRFAIDHESLAADASGYAGE